MNIQLKNVRKSTNLTQTEVASKVGISTRAYQNYEADKRVPDVYTAIAIADTLNVSIEKIFTRK